VELGRSGCFSNFFRAPSLSESKRWLMQGFDRGLGRGRERGVKGRYPIPAAFSRIYCHDGGRETGV
jgi:hypothetical protein